MDDNQIIDLYFERNEYAIRETEKKYGRLCHSVAHHILGNESDAEECVNDTYLGLWNAIPPERPRFFKAFVCKIARNVSLKKLEYNRAGKRYNPDVLSFSELEEVLPDAALTHDIAEESLGDLLSAFLREEKEYARNVFIRRYYFNDSIIEIAELYDFSEAKVKSMLFHTRNRLKAYLTEKGVYV